MPVVMERDVTKIQIGTDGNEKTKRACQGNKEQNPIILKCCAIFIVGHKRRKNRNRTRTVKIYRPSGVCVRQFSGR